jgi:hypothetical protein
MVPIIVKSYEKKYTEEEFLSDIIRKTDEAIRQEKVLTHCILIYSQSNPFMIKLLEDETFYTSLNDISGSYINIYHTISPVPTRRIRQHNARRIFTANGEQLFQFLPDVNTLNTTEDEKKYNNIINKLNEMYSLDIDASGPGIMFFLFDVNTQKIENAFYYELNEISVDGLFREIRDILKIVKDCVSNVLDENINNQYEIYNLFINNVKLHKIKTKFYGFISNPISNLIFALKP